MKQVPRTYRFHANPLLSSAIAWTVDSIDGLVVIILLNTIENTKKKKKQKKKTLKKNKSKTHKQVDDIAKQREEIDERKWRMDIASSYIQQTKKQVNHE